MATFGASFKAARSAGKKEFTWEGKRYTTKVAATVKTPKTAPVPKSGTVARMKNGMDKKAAPATAAKPAAKPTTVSTPAKAPIPKSGTVARMQNGMDKATAKPAAKAAMPATGRDRNGPVAKAESFREKFKKTTGSKIREALKIKIK